MYLVVQYKTLAILRNVAARSELQFLLRNMTISTIDI